MDEMVKIYVPATCDGDNHDIVITLNGGEYQLKRGKLQTVPRGVAELYAATTKDPDKCLKLPKIVELDMAEGDQKIDPPGDNCLAFVVVKKPDTLDEANIKTGVTIGGKAGTYTSDATAEPGDILSGKTAYVNGEKITGTYEPAPSLDLGYLTFSSESAFTLCTQNNNKNWDGRLEYSTDAVNWTEWTGTSGIASANGKLYLRGFNNRYLTGGNSNNSDTRYFRISESGVYVSCSGNVMDLLDCRIVALGDTPLMGTAAFAHLFYNMKLTSAPELPSTRLAPYCYSSMFKYTAITAAPALPATTMAENCYSYMFANCLGLTAPPELPATTLANMCYSYMFYNSAVNTLASIGATALSQYCCNNMFSGSAVKVSTEQDATYAYEYRIPSDGTGTDAGSALNGMFNSTRGSFTGTPSINTIYYTDKEPIAPAT